MMDTLTNYLSSKIAPSSLKRYQRELDIYFLQMNKKGIIPEQATYTQIMDYLRYLRKKIKSGKINCSLYALKHYYSYLLSEGIRADHPCKSITLRDKPSKDIQLQDLFTTAELSLLLERKERYVLLRNRNRIIVSLLIYQGLTSGEITRLAVASINLEQGTIQISEARKTNGRTLKLESKQIYWLMCYLQEDRQQLLQGNKSHQLLISHIGGRPLTVEGISSLIDTLKYHYPNKQLNAKTIRQSVIANLLKSGADLRVVQAFAGHKYPSTTERYKQTEVEELKNQILKYHPLR